jgi:uncharacterized protein
MTDFGVETISLDLPALVGAFGRRLHEAGVPVTAEHDVRFAAALTLVGRVATVSRRRLYWTARAVFVSDQVQVKLFDRVFSEVFDGGRGLLPVDESQLPIVSADENDLPGKRGAQERDEAFAGGVAPAPASAADRGGRDEPGDRDVPLPTVASDEEVLRAKRFDALEPDELAAIYRLMARLAPATPERRTRRAEHCRRGERIDLRRTLRRSLRTGGDPIRLARRRRRVVQRRLVILCDISGSMEPYARAYLQFLSCAAGGGANAEAFVFATRLTRLTRALGSRNPERAIQRAAATAPDWSSGTRIGDALKSFNDRHGRRGMARGAVIVILSDGWERGDPALVGREMERLSRLAHRIVWVNPRVAAPGFSPRAGGMAAALPHCDALVSGHSLEALDEVVEAIGGGVLDPRASVPAAPPEPPDESWASATPVPGSSVAMPSGYGPSRGRTNSEWGSR